jgi:hypothetical protein
MNVNNFLKRVSQHEYSNKMKGQISKYFMSNTLQVLVLVVSRSRRTRTRTRTTAGTLTLLHTHTHLQPILLRFPFWRRLPPGRRLLQCFPPSLARRVFPKRFLLPQHFPRHSSVRVVLISFFPFSSIYVLTRSRDLCRARLPRKDRHRRNRFQLTQRLQHDLFCLFQIFFAVQVG